TCDQALCVANSIDDGTTTLGLSVVSPASISGVYGAVEGAFTKPLAQAGPVQAPVVCVQPNDACAALSNSAAVAGNIALIDRGACLFVDQIQRAQDAGAVAVIMVNNVPGTPIVMTGSSSSITIPGVMIGQSD